MASSPIMPPGLLTPPDERKTLASQFTTLYIQNETSSKNPNLRYRNRSQDSAPPSFEQSSPENMNTPESQYKRVKLSGPYISTPDSGIEGSFSSPRFVTPKKRLEEEFIRSDEKVESPLDYLERRFYRKRNALFNSDSGKFKPQQMLPIIIVTVILASSIFTLFAFKAAVGRRFSENGDIIPTNGKYRSMEYAVKSWVKRLEDSGKPLPYDIKTENGEGLFGKKASIGYAHEVQKRSMEPEEDNSQISNEMEHVEDNHEKMPTQEEKIKRKLLLDKLAKSGNLPSNPVPKRPEMETDKNSEKVASEPEIEKIPESKNKPHLKRKGRPIKPVQTPNSPFESLNANVGLVEEDDPFRFRSV